MTQYFLICCLWVAGAVWAAEPEVSIGEKRGSSQVAGELKEASPQRQRVERFGEIGQSRPQIYGFATYDALFKYVLGQNKEVRASFLHAFLSTLAPDVDSNSSERLDDHMNPLEDFQVLRRFVHDRETDAGLEELKKFRYRYVVKGRPPREGDIEEEKELEKATSVLAQFVAHFSDIKKAFPKARYDGTMDFVCKLKDGGYALIEMQVVPQDYWDRRALAYAAHFYGKQLHKGGKWKSLRKVIAINILGGGREERQHWPDTPTQFMRHYKFQKQIHPQERFIDGIELIQYSLMNAPKKLENKEQEDWLTFLRRSALMTPKEVEETITTPEVKKAFQYAKLDKLPAEVRKYYEEEDKEYMRYSQHTESLVNKGRAEGEQLGRVKTLLELNYSDEGIITKTPGLTPEELQKIKANIAAEQSAPAFQGGGEK